MSENPTPAFGQVWEYDFRYKVMVVSSEPGAKNSWLAVMIDATPDAAHMLAIERADGELHGCYLKSRGWVYLYG